MDLRETYAAMPGAAPLDDLPDAWHWAKAPGFDYSAALFADGGRVFQAYALDSYDEGLAVALLSFARSHSAELAIDRPLSLAEGFSHPGYAFDAVVSVSPSLHRLYPDNAELNALVHPVVPAHRCEFAGDEDQADAEIRYGRPSGVPGTRWGRKPVPYVKSRFRGDNGFLPDDREFVRPKLVVSWLTNHEGREDLFLEFENYRHEVHTITWTSTWTLTGPDGSATTPAGFEDLLEAVKAALYGPNTEAADFPG